MATSAVLRLEQFITTLDGKRCTAVPRTDVSTQTSTTSAFSSLSTSSTSSTLLVAASPAEQTIGSTTSAPLPVAATTSSSSSIEQTSASVVVSFSTSATSSAAVRPQAQSSVTNTGLTAASAGPTTTPDTGASQATATTASAAQTDASQSNAQNGGSLTTIQIAAGQSVTSADAQNAATATASVVAVSSTSSGGHSSHTAAIVGGVFGGLVGIALIALLIWFWRKQIKKRRRSTLLTPLSTDPWSGYGAREKRGFLLGDDTQGATMRMPGIKNKVRAQYGRVRGGIGSRLRSASVHSTSSLRSGRSVDLNRGNSQYMNTSPLMTHNRKGSSAFSMADDSDMTIKEQIMGLFSRIMGRSRTQESGFNEKNDIFSARGLGEAKNYTASSPRQVIDAPDFLTLVNMDDGELANGAQQRRHSRIRGGSEGSAITKFSQQSSISPFSDIHAIPGPSGPQPSTYIQDMRRSRGQSLGAGSIDLNKVYDMRGLRIVNGTTAATTTTLAARSRPPSDQVSNGPAGSSISPRDSQVSDLSFASFATKRNKFRSDPFDLEELSTSLPSNIGYPPLPFAAAAAAAAAANSGSSTNTNRLSRPQAAHTRHISDGSSKYTSGVADGVFDEWSDPGPDIGPIVR